MELVLLAFEVQHIAEKIKKGNKMKKSILLFLSVYVFKNSVSGPRYDIVKDEGC